MRGATCPISIMFAIFVNFNPHSPCGERRWKPLKGCFPVNFNPHSPCGERPELIRTMLVPSEFQSTLPMRGATFLLQDKEIMTIISIHTPHAGSDHYLHHTSSSSLNFNPHSPCGERHHVREKLFYSLSFQSTLPMRGATPITGISCTFCQRISIHTPHAGSDGACIPIAAWWHISIHTPHAGSDDD